MVGASFRVVAGSWYEHIVVPRIEVPLSSWAQAEKSTAGEKAEAGVEEGCHGLQRGSPKLDGEGALSLMMSTKLDECAYPDSCCKFSGFCFS